MAGAAYWLHIYFVLRLKVLSRTRVRHVIMTCVRSIPIVSHCTMTKAITPRTPTRRSKRFQPLVTPSRAPDYPSDVIWSGLPVHIRPTDPELDLLDEERITWNKDEDDKEELETTFYEGFEKRRKPMKSTKRGKKSVAKAKKDDVERYQVGDTVLVSTFSFSKRKPPSIGLIVSMWETRPIDEEDESDEEKMRVRVHWFLRPSELASIRAKRDHAKVWFIHIFTGW